MYASGISNLFSFGLRQLAQDQQDIQSALERLSTGKRVNRASDDPGAISAIEQHKTEIFSLNKQLDALARSEGFLGAKEGGLSVVSDLMVELEALVVRGANTAGNTQSEQDAIRDGINSILSGIDQIASSTVFNGQQVMREFTTGQLDDDLRSLAEIFLKDPERAQKIVESAREGVSRTRAVIGTELNEIDSRRDIIAEQLTNLNASRSTIEDTDFAAESARLVRSQILESASIAAIDISRQSAGQVLDLLKSSTQLIRPIN